jgi:hypothetical protein
MLVKSVKGGDISADTDISVQCRPTEKKVDAKLITRFCY